MKLLIIDPNISQTSPSMKGVVRSLPHLRAAGFEIELWCWQCDPGVVADRIVRLPRFGRLHTIGGYAFSFWVRLRRWWCLDVRKEPRPDVTYTVAWYLPKCDVCHVHFSSWDWQRRQQELGTRSLRDVYERVTGAVGLWFANAFLKHTTATSLISVSEAVAGDLRKAAPSRASRVAVLPNSYDAARFHAGVRGQWRDSTREQLGFSAADTVFVFVSTGHYRRKGFFLAADAVKQLRTTHSGARLLVVGGRDSRLRSLQAQLTRKSPDWREWITFSGNVPDVERYFAAADGLLFPSYSEAFALVEVEAAACGLPLFLTRHHGSEMILEDGANGRFVEFEAGRIAGVLGEFIDGSWRPSPSNLSRALDGNEYASELCRLLKQAARITHPSEMPRRVPAKTLVVK